MALGSPDSTRSESLHEKLVASGRRGAPRLVLSPLLCALETAGTRHMYGDTADVDELWGVAAPSADAVLAEIDGNTVNQPLVRRVLDRYLARGARELATARRELRRGELAPYLYTILCGWIGNAVARFGGGRPWEVSLQLHMATVEGDPRLAAHLGRSLRGMVPSCLVKVPFKPQTPHTFLLARDLERDGIPVNFTSTFSARQAVAAALLATIVVSILSMASSAATATAQGAIYGRVPAVAQALAPRPGVEHLRDRGAGSRHPRSPQRRHRLFPRRRHGAADAGLRRATGPPPRLARSLP